LPLPGIIPWFLGCPVHSLVTISTELSWISLLNYYMILFLILLHTTQLYFITPDTTYAAFLINLRQSIIHHSWNHLQLCKKVYITCWYISRTLTSDLKVWTSLYLKHDNYFKHCPLAWNFLGVSIIM
jgi:hypothetical protein